MTYWLILCVVPKTDNNSGAIKIKVSRRMYEEIIGLELPVIDCDEGLFQITSKKMFSIEADNSAFIVCECLKLPKG